MKDPNEFIRLRGDLVAHMMLHPGQEDDPDTLAEILPVVEKLILRHHVAFLGWLSEAGWDWTPAVLELLRSEHKLVVLELERRGVKVKCRRRRREDHSA